ncbi:hydrolase [Halomicroarcula sp. S1AR25-4]|uniref:hydrolase n=1 Tax=Haloarcula sp. S1AR25-4 TaxID=2950538 RepID=UPI0028750F9E|nr:hydrolase [Halomicroarcula sp. S1AR25-4]MDS0277347.1 hydrolase [Halomicroarcula sp. S1AR25-4]
MSLEWRGAAVAPDDEMPTPETWDPVSVPGRPTAFAGADAVAYETTFSDPRNEDEAHAVLVLRGTYAQTRVWCNDEQVATHDAYFTPLRVRLPDAEEYRVVVECRVPEDRFGGLHATEALPDERCVPGIWWGARLETYPDPYVSAVRARPRLTDEGAAVDVTADVVANEAIDDRITFSIRPQGNVRGGGMMDRSRVATGSGHTTVQHTIDVRDPSLWWPHDRGDQPRYVVRAKLDDAANEITTGLRTVSYDDEELRVNGERVPARGVTLLDPTPEDVARAADANANLVRVRAQATPPAVAEACDEHGLLLWQDLPLTGPGGFDVDRGKSLARELEREYGHHPSLTALGVHDDPVSPYADGLGSGFLDRLRFRFRAWRADYDAGPADTVADVVDAVPAFPVIGPPGIDPDAVTLYPGWQYGTVSDLSWLCDHYGVGDVVGGFGAGSLGTDDPADETGFDRATHDARVDGGVTDSQTYQARVVQTVTEHLRRQASEVAILDSLRDVGDAGMGVLEEDGTAKPAYAVLTDGYEPTQVVLSDPTPGESDVVVCHDRPDTATVTVEWDHNGEREQEEHTVGPFGRVTVGSLTLAAGDELTLAVAVGDGVVTNEYEICGSI